MNLLLEALISPDVLTLQSSTRRITRDTDACNVQAGCVLLQAQHNNKTKLIEYWSRSFTNAKRIFNTSQFKCLTSVSAVLLQQSFQEGTQFTIRKANTSLKRIKERILKHYIFCLIYDIVLCCGLLSPQPCNRCGKMIVESFEVF